MKNKLHGTGNYITINLGQQFDIDTKSHVVEEGKETANIRIGIIFRNVHRVHRFILCLNYMMFPLVPSPLLYLRSPNGGCCTISDDLSCSFWSSGDFV